MIAESMPSFTREEYPSITRYYVGLDLDHVSQFLRLVELVRGWKTSRITVDNRTLTVMDIYKLISVLNCHLDKRGYSHQKYYCWVSEYSYPQTNLLFPCKNIKLTLSNICDGENYGTLDSEGNLHINKERVLFQIERELRTSLSYYCPSLDMEALENILLRIPDTITAHDISLIMDATKKPSGLWLSFGSEGEIQKKKENINWLNNILKDIQGLD
ncbi:MAG: hypothetical protein JW732_00990 [Dehalococcoidia bacterium]|nr:hypothetical protein [Dehalococcoidia bacterium]